MKVDSSFVLAARNELARRDFWQYRNHIHADLKDGWWQRVVAKELMQFRLDLLAGKRPNLLIQAPPQHGKSVQIVDFVSWLAGLNPEVKTIYTSFSERLGVRANLTLQRIYDSPKYQDTFQTRISQRNAVTVSGQHLRNREILEYVGDVGYFRNTTVRGSITGEALDLGIIDDPIKGREEANSSTVRDRTYDWLTDDFMSRFSEGAGLLGIMTRWHLDDPFGRLIDADPAIKVLRYPAIAEHDSEFRKSGEALFPAHKSIDFLNERKAKMSSASFEALYQQSPTVAGGEIFKDEWWQYWSVLPEFVRVKIFADTAQKTKQQNDYSVFQCWGYTKTGAYLIDQIRGKWEAPDLLVRARAFWSKHKGAEDYKPAGQMAIEDKVSGTGLIQTLKREGIPIQAIQRGTDKVTRAYDAVPHIEAGNVYLPKSAPWLSDFLGEACAFPNGAFDDQVDPMMDAIADLSKPTVELRPIRARAV